MTNCRKANALLSTLFISAMALTSGALAHAQLASEVVGTPEIGGVASEPSLNPDSATERPTQFALTRSGAVWEGKVVDNGDSYTIELPAGGSLTATRLDVLYIGSSRQDVFAYKVKTTRLEDVNELIKLADWAGRRQMAPEAIKLLGERLEIVVDEAERHALQRKLDELVVAEEFRAKAARAIAERNEKTAVSESPATTGAADESADLSEDAKLDLWGRSLPPATLERFGRVALPILQKRCATSGCHSSDTPGARYVVRDKAFGAAQRLALLYTLRDTIAYIDFEDTESSPILAHPTVTNYRGERVYPFGSDRYSARDCANFVEWLNGLGGERALAESARKIRNQRDNEPSLRPDSASRYDVADAANAQGAVSPENARFTTDSNESFAGLFDDSSTETQPNAQSASNANEHIFQQGISQDSMQFIPNPLDDVNSTESTLARVGLAPRKTYRDEYDPAIFNDRYHVAKPASVSPPAGPAPADPAAPVDVTAPEGRAAIF